MGSSSAGNVSSEAVNICSYLVPHYLSGLPVDPSVNEGEAVADCSRIYDTGYTIMLDANGHVVVSAPKAELNTSISVSR